jgi:hypothetical protein
MRNKQKTLLAGVAAVALFAGAGVALAQQNPESQKSSPSTPGMSEQSGTHAQTAKPTAGGNMEQHAQPGTDIGTKTGGAMNIKSPETNQPSTAEQGSQGAKGENRSAQDSKGDKMGPAADKAAPSRQKNLGANDKSKGEQNRSATRSERNGSLKGLQGNTSLPMQGNVNLNEHQKTTIRDRVINAHGAPRVGHVDFDVAVGTAVPRDRIDLVPVPDTLVRIEPRWHGYLYFVYEDEIVIVNPHDMRIVAVVTV